MGSIPVGSTTKKPQDIAVFCLSKHNMLYF